MPINPADKWYRAEVTPPNLAALAVKLRDHYGVGPINIGSKGDLNHMRGYHRSRAFIANSPYCTDRAYSVTAPVNKGGDANWLSAMDITIPKAELIAACRRLDAAARAGVIEKVVEWYGNTNDDQRVDGWDNIYNVVSSSDSSHLWHLHLSFARSRANDNHDDLFDILTGGDDMPTAQEIAAAVWSYRVENAAFDDKKAHSTHEAIVAGINVPGRLAALTGKVDALLGEVDQAEELGQQAINEIRLIPGADPEEQANLIVSKLGPAQAQQLVAALGAAISNG